MVVIVPVGVIVVVPVAVRVIVVVNENPDGNRWKNSISTERRITR